MIKTIATILALKFDRTFVLGHNMFLEAYIEFAQYTTRLRETWNIMSLTTVNAAINQLIRETRKASASPWAW